MSDTSHRPSRDSGRQPFQLRMADLFLITTLLAISLSGVANTIGRLPTVAIIKHLNVWGDVAPPPRVVSRHRNSQIAVAIAVGLLSVAIPSFTAWWLVRHAPAAFRRSAPRIAGTLGCLAFVAVLSSIQGFDYWKQQVMRGDWRYVMGGEWIGAHAAISSPSVQIAVATLCVVVALEVVTAVRRRRGRRVVPDRAPAAAQ